MEQETYIFRNTDDDLKAEKIRKALFPAVLIMAVALIAVICLLLFARCEKPAPEENEDRPKTALYLKTGELNFTDTQSALRLSSSLKVLANGENYSFSQEWINRFGEFTYISEDGKRVFFADRANATEGGVYLYYTDTDKSDPAPVLIGKDVTEYTVSEDGERVVYLNSGAELYIYDFKDSKLISEGVAQYLVSPDGKRVYLRDSKANLYSFRQGGKLTLMTEALVLSLNGADKSFDTVYYTDAYNNVLRQKQGGLPVAVIRGDESAYLRTAMYSFENGDAYFVCNRSGGTDSSEIWYMSAEGKAQKLSLENAGSITCLTAAKEAAAAVFEIKHIDGSKTEYFVAAGAFLTKIHEDTQNENYIKAQINEEGTEIYFSEIHYAKTYFVKIDGISVSKPTESGEMLDNELRGFYGDGYFALYSWQTEDGVSEQGVTLYKNGEAVTRLRDIYTVRYCEKTDAFYFVSGYNEKTAKGTLMMYKENKLTELEKDVFDFTVTLDGDLLYIKEYDTAKKRGNLYLWSEEGAVSIDRDVASFVETTDGTRKIWQ